MNRIEQLKQIKDGILNYVFTDPEVEELATERIEFCKPCRSRHDNVCSECGCVLKIKTRSPKATCPLKKW